MHRNEKYSCRFTHCWARWKTEACCHCSYHRNVSRTGLISPGLARNFYLKSSWSSVLGKRSWIIAAGILWVPQRSQGWPSPEEVTWSAAVPSSTLWLSALALDFSSSTWWTSVAGGALPLFGLENIYPDLYDHCFWGLKHIHPMGVAYHL